MDGLIFETIDQQGLGWLERPFEEDEVHKVVQSMVSDKALGSDGFIMEFFQVCWELIKDDLRKVFQEFHAIERFAKKPLHYFYSSYPEKVQDNGC